MLKNTYFKSMITNTSNFAPLGDDDANYDENDAAWQEEDKNELDEFGFKAEGDEEEEEEEEEEKTSTKVSDDDDEDDEEEDDDEGFGLE